jgi:hypothetical protein
MRFAGAHDAETMSSRSAGGKRNHRISRRQPPGLSPLSLAVCVAGVGGLELGNVSFSKSRPNFLVFQNIFRTRDFSRFPGPTPEGRPLVIVGYGDGEEEDADEPPQRQP